MGCTNPVISWRPRINKGVGVEMWCEQVFAVSRYSLFCSGTSEQRFLQQTPPILFLGFCVPAVEVADGMGHAEVA